MGAVTAAWYTVGTSYIPVFFIMSNRLTPHLIPTFLFFKSHSVAGQTMGPKGVSVPECGHLSYRKSPVLLAPEPLSPRDALKRY